ncbi:molybdenum cofactor guanylyltransferase [Pedobacter agri]|uniref:molybdenum cofactor guanylyltransferase n=1 Tax=Pedobacter agri TaxID=454586 RepID=UPI00292DDB12|nr:molybdenum cofactor guanylyltransferase [Pedobacter agri]
MLGIVLCGGKSIRMGTDKGLLNHHGKPWAEIASDKLKKIGREVKFSINPHQKEKYINYFDEAHLIIDDPSLEINGPLLGVLSAHLKNPKADLFLLACDLLLMETRVLNKVIEVRATHKFYEAIIFKKKDQLEPLCGIYTAAALTKIMLWLQRGELHKHSMKFVLSKLEVLAIEIEQEDYRCFDNFNSHAEINGL